MTKVLYIPTGDFLTFLKSIYSFDMHIENTTIIWEESLIYNHNKGIYTVCDYLNQLEDTPKRTFIKRNKIQFPILKEEFEIIYD